MVCYFFFGYIFFIEQKGVHYMKRKSLSQAILKPFLLFTLFIIITFIMIWRLEMRFSVRNQGMSKASLIGEYTQSQMADFFKEPININTVLVAATENQKLYSDLDLFDLGELILKTYERIYEDVPQVSVISYGDEQERYVGIRHNDGDGDFNLMLKDRRTNFMLNIYDGTDMDSSVLASIPYYNPRVRPWYAPVLLNKEKQWSAVYVNVDEKAESTISSMMPVFDGMGTFVGVLEVDVKLQGIHDFLKEMIDHEEGFVIILDETNRVVASSAHESTVSSEGLMKVQDLEEERLTSAFEHLNALQMPFYDVERLRLDREFYYAAVYPLDYPNGLNWKTIVLISEDAIIGESLNRQWIILFLFVTTAVFATFLAYRSLKKVTEPVLKTASTAMRISQGDWNEYFQTESSQLLEIQELTGAFNTMLKHLKASFESIEEKEAAYRFLVENLEGSIYSIDQEQCLTWCNKAFERDVNQLRDEFIGQPIKELLKTYLVDEKQLDFMDRVYSEKKHYSFTNDLFLGDDQRQVKHIKWMPFFDEKGEVNSVLGTHIDMTQLIETQEAIEALHRTEKERLEVLVEEKKKALSEAMEELLEKEKMASLGSLVSGVAHEINTPLGVAFSAASYIETISEKNEKLLRTGEMTKGNLEDFIHHLKESIHVLNLNLNRSIELVKSFKAIAVDQSIDDAVNINLYDYIHTILLSVKHEYKNRNLDIQVTCPKNLHVRTYPGAIAQIVTNLLMNSLEHAYRGDESGTIKIDVLEDEADIEIKYSDDGCGIPEDVISRIYEPFFTTNRRNGGSGLGLNIVYNLVKKKLAGSIRCQSVEGQGTTFIIQFKTNKE